MFLSVQVLICLRLYPYIYIYIVVYVTLDLSSMFSFLGCILSYFSFRLHVLFCCRLCFILLWAMFYFAVGCVSVWTNAA